MVMPWLLPRLCQVVIHHLMNTEFLPQILIHPVSNIEFYLKDEIDKKQNPQNQRFEEVQSANQQTALR